MPNTRYTFTASPAGLQGYQWAVKGMGTIVSGQDTSSITVSTNENPAGSISVAVDNGCGYGHESNKTLMVCNAISVQTYPVPSEDYLNLRISSFYEEQNIEQSAEEVRENDEYEIRLYNDHSLLIRQMKTKSKEVSIDVSDLSAKVYLLQVRYKGMSASRKVMVGKL